MAAAWNPGHKRGYTATKGIPNLYTILTNCSAPFTQMSCPCICLPRIEVLPKLWCSHVIFTLHGWV